MGRRGKSKLQVNIRVVRTKKGENVNVRDKTKEKRREPEHIKAGSLSSIRSAPCILVGAVYAMRRVSQGSQPGRLGRMASYRPKGVGVTSKTIKLRIHCSVKVAAEHNRRVSFNELAQRFKE